MHWKRDSPDHRGQWIGNATKTISVSLGNILFTISYLETLLLRSHVRHLVKRSPIAIILTLLAFLLKCGTIPSTVKRLYAFSNDLEGVTDESVRSWFPRIKELKHVDRRG